MGACPSELELGWRDVCWPQPLLLAPGSVAGRRALLQFSAVRPRGDPLIKGPSVQLFVAQPRFSHKLPRWTPQLLGSTSAGLCSRPASEESSLGPGKEPQAKRKQGGIHRHLFKRSLNRMCCLPLAQEFQEISGTIVSGFCLLGGVILTVPRTKVKPNTDVIQSPWFRSTAEFSSVPI